MSRSLCAVLLSLALILAACDKDEKTLNDGTPEKDDSPLTDIDPITDEDLLSPDDDDNTLEALFGAPVLNPSGAAP